MADSKRSVELNVGVTTSGAESLEALGRELHDLSTATKANRNEEAAARTETALAKTALAEKREALSLLRIQTDSAARAAPNT